MTDGVRLSVRRSTFNSFPGLGTDRPLRDEYSTPASRSFSSANNGKAAAWQSCKPLPRLVLCTRREVNSLDARVQTARRGQTCIVLARVAPAIPLSPVYRKFDRGPDALVAFSREATYIPITKSFDSIGTIAINMQELIFVTVIHILRLLRDVVYCFSLKHRFRMSRMKSSHSS